MNKSDRFMINVEARRCSDSVIPKQWRSKYVYAMYSLMQKDSDFYEKITREAQDIALKISRNLLK